MSVNFEGKVRRVQNDLKEPRDGTDRVVGLVTISTEVAGETMAELLLMQRQGLCRISVEPVQAELPLERPLDGQQALP